MIARSDREGSRPSPETVTTFQVAVPQAALDDLKRRLVDPRWPDKEPVSDWSQGLPLANAQRLIAYWRDVYDWRACETRLNSYPQFRTEVDGLGFHFIHVRSAHENALPIILTHGWPGSVIEFLKTIGPLTDPTAHGGRAEDAFHVVIPSLPGFGFSDQPKEIGWDVTRTAKAWHVLMERLGYSRWVAQGGDWGSAVTTVLAQLRPSGLVAAHVNWPFVIPVPPPQNPTPDEKRPLMPPRLSSVMARATSANRRPDRKRWHVVLPTRRPVKPPGSTRSFGNTPTTRATPKTPFRWTKCWITSHSIG
jgi:pimeloyl-ACP methyl ester carboxylesterase